MDVGWRQTISPNGSSDPPDVVFYRIRRTKKGRSNTARLFRVAVGLICEENRRNSQSGTQSMTAWVPTSVRAVFFMSGWRKRVEKRSSATPLLVRGDVGGNPAPDRY
jgi:hypothetical protein